MCRCALGSCCLWRVHVCCPPHVVRCPFAVHVACRVLHGAACIVQIERLTDDFLASTWEATAQTSGVFPYGNEAPAMFKRGNYYYALISDSCCYCGQGGLVSSLSTS